MLVCIIFEKTEAVVKSQTAWENWVALPQCCDITWVGLVGRQGFEPRTR